jgi:hypothetical protein
MTAFIATEMIDGWSCYWHHEISDDNLEAMTQFALTYPEAALHRWSIMAGPQPWIPNASEFAGLATNPRHSVADSLAQQRQQPPEQQDE